MKRKLLSLVLLLSPALAYSQAGNVGLGTLNPGTTLDVNGAITARETAVTVAANQATIPPNVSQCRITGAATTLILLVAPAAPNPGQLLTVYNNTTGGQGASLNGYTVANGRSLSFTYTNNAWQATDNGASTTSPAWTLSGNAGTNPATSFIGTTDNAALSFRVNNTKAGRIGNGDANTSIGLNSLSNTTTGNANTASGNSALQNNGTGSNNTASGSNALLGNTSGGSNTAGGSGALQNNTAGSQNTADGTNALIGNTSGNGNTAIGAGADVASGNLSNATAIGANAIVGASNMMQIGNNNVTDVYFGNGSTTLLHGLTSGWSLTGNTGTNPNTNFIGTTDNVPLNFRVSNNKAGRISPTDGNTSFGYLGLGLLTSGNNNTATGAAALQNNSAGNNNTASGSSAMQVNTTGSNNTASGNSSLFYNLTGSSNTAVGFTALLTNTSGNGNTAIGSGADVASSNLSNATAIGAGALAPASNMVQIGNSNVTDVYFGNGTTTLLHGLTGGWSLTGNANTNPFTNFIGTTDNNPLIFRVNNTKSGQIGNNDGNTALGFNTLGSISVNPGTYNTAVGHSALQSNSSGNYNTAIGSTAMQMSGSSGSYNTAIGSATLQNNSAGSGNTAIGYGANVATYNLSNATAIGTNAVVGASNMVQIGNSNVTDVYFGNGTTTLLHGLTGGWSLTGNANTNPATNFIGTTDYNPLVFRVNNTRAGRIGTDGNTSFGYLSLSNVTTGNNNTASGTGSLMSNTSGYQNTASGTGTLTNNTIGYQNTASGNNALQNNSIGYQNTATGNEALVNTTSGFANTAVGYNSLQVNITGNGNTAIGSGADVSSSNLSNATAIGAGATVNATNKVRIGSSAVTVVELAAAATVSDGRFKKDVSGAGVPGLDFILQLRPVSYHFDYPGFSRFIGEKGADKAALAKRSQSLELGFIAQDVEALVAKTGVTFNAVNAPQSAKDNYSLSYLHFVMPLVKAVQEQQAQIEALKAQNEKLLAQAAEVTNLRAAVADMQAQLNKVVLPKTGTDDHAAGK